VKLIQEVNCLRIPGVTSGVVRSILFATIGSQAMTHIHRGSGDSHGIQTQTITVKSAKRYEITLSEASQLHNLVIKGGHFEVKMVHVLHRPRESRGRQSERLYQISF
jgi:hypothetical protein